MIAIHSPNRSACRFAMPSGRLCSSLRRVVLPSLALFLFPFQAFRYPITHAASVLYLETSLSFWFLLRHRETLHEAAGEDRPQDERGNPVRAVFRQVVSHSTSERSARWEYNAISEVASLQVRCWMKR